MDTYISDVVKLDFSLTFLSRLGAISKAMNLVVIILNLERKTVNGGEIGFDHIQERRYGRSGFWWPDDISTDTSILHCSYDNVWGFTKWFKPDFTIQGSIQMD